MLAGNGPRSHTHDIAVADVNADGNPDVMTTNANDNTISVLLGDGKGGFTELLARQFAQEGILTM